jgi:hypothetical protein
MVRAFWRFLLALLLIKMFVHVQYILYHGEASKNLQNALTVEYGTNYTYLHAHMPKMNSSSVKICESSRPLLARFLPASHPKILNCYSHCNKEAGHSTSFSCHVYPVSDRFVADHSHKMFG